MKIGRSLCLTLLFATLGSSAVASTIVQTHSAGLTNVGVSFAVPVSFDAFNPAQGTLTGVTLGLTASFSGTVGVENRSNVPDIAAGIIAGSVTVTTGNALLASVSPNATGPTHTLSAFDGTLDFAGTSGATDSVAGAPVSTAVFEPAGIVPVFVGRTPIFLTLTATSFPIVEGQEKESVRATANALASVELTYTFTPVPEPRTVVLVIAGMLPLLLFRRQRTVHRLSPQNVKIPKMS